MEEDVEREWVEDDHFNVGDEDDIEDDFFL